MKIFWYDITAKFFKLCDKDKFYNTRCNEIYKTIAGIH